jgi:signal peptidase II
MGEEETLPVKVNWHRLLLFPISLAVILLDQYTKALVREHLPLNVSVSLIPWLDPIVTFTHTRNTGASFGLLPNTNTLFMVIAGIVVALIAVSSQRISTPSNLLQVALGLQMAGAAGNFIDRLLFGYVTDFVDVRIWPIWNIADNAVVVGTILLAYYAIFVDREPRHEAASPVAPTEASPTSLDTDHGPS